MGGGEGLMDIQLSPEMWPMNKSAHSSIVPVQAPQEGTVFGSTGGGKAFLGSELGNVIFGKNMI